MSALIYQPNPKWRFGAALAAAALIHLAAVSFATTHREEPKTPPKVTGDPTVELESPEPIVDPQTEPPDPLPTPPAINDFYVEDTATPPPVRSQSIRSTPLVRPRTNRVPNSLNLASAKVLALNAPRPEYPYEARRQKITGDGIVVMTIDPSSGDVIQVTMSKSTGNQFLDNAALAGFRRWRFKPGTVSSVICPVTFTLTGASY